MSSKLIFQVEKTQENIRSSILTNIVKMLVARGLIELEKQQESIQKLINTTSDEMIYFIDLANSKFGIKIIPHKITAINKSFGISDFLNDNKNLPKIVVVNEISKKARQHILKNYADTEIFLEEELLINLIDSHIIPKHILLTENEKKEVLEKYGAKQRSMPKMLHTEAVARYYNMKVGDICRILRPSDKSGITVAYRLVIKGSYK